MRIRAAVMCLAIGMVSIPSYAQTTNGPTLQSLSAAVEALKSRVAKLEGQFVAGDVAGTYTVAGIQTHLESLVPGSPNPQPPARNAGIGSLVLNGTLVLRGNGTGSLTSTENGAFLTQGPWSLTHVNDTDVESLRWTLSKGTLTLDFGDGAVSLSALPGGRLFVGSFAFSEPGDWADALLVIATRQP